MFRGIAAMFAVTALVLFAMFVCAVAIGVVAVACYYGGPWAGAGMAFGIVVGIMAIPEQKE